MHDEPEQQESRVEHAEARLDPDDGQRESGEHERPNGREHPEAEAPPRLTVVALALQQRVGGGRVLQIDPAAGPLQ